MLLSWELLIDQVAACQACALCGHRKQSVFGEGNREADILFVGEGPGRDEDLQGRPFVGPAGQLLDKMLAAIDLDRSQAFIAKPRAGGGRSAGMPALFACTDSAHQAEDHRLSGIHSCALYLRPQCPHLERQGHMERNKKRMDTAHLSPGRSPARSAQKTRGVG